MKQTARVASNVPMYEKAISRFSAVCATFNRVFIALKGTLFLFLFGVIGQFGQVFISLYMYMHHDKLV